MTDKAIRLPASSKEVEAAKKFESGVAAKFESDTFNPLEFFQEESRPYYSRDVFIPIALSSSRQQINVVVRSLIPDRYSNEASPADTANRIDYFSIKDLSSDALSRMRRYIERHDREQLSQINLQQASGLRLGCAPRVHIGHFSWDVRYALYDIDQYDLVPSVTHVNSLKKIELNSLSDFFSRYSCPLEFRVALESIISKEIAGLLQARFAQEESLDF